MDSWEIANNLTDNWDPSCCPFVGHFFAGLFMFNPKQVLKKLSPWFSIAELYEFLQERKRNFRDYTMSFNH